MSSIRGVGGGVSPMMFDDPMMAAEALSIDEARGERAAARQDRQAALSERDALIDQSLVQERAAADARLASAVIGGALKIAQGAMSATAAVIDHAGSGQRREAENKITTLRRDQHVGAQGQPTQTAEQQAEIRSLNDRADNNTERAAWIRAGSESTGGVAQALSGALDFVADGHRIHGKELEKQADRARDRAEDARERGQGAGEVASRMLNRAEDIARAQRQAEDQRIANMRG